MATAPIMVVGGSAFLGSHVCRELAEKKFEFICFDIQSPESQRANLKSTPGTIRFVRGDILDQNSFSDCVRDHAAEFKSAFGSSKSETNQGTRKILKDFWRDLPITDFGREI